MVISRKRRQEQKPEDHIPESIFDALSANPPGNDTGGDRASRKREEKKGPSVDDLIAQLSKLENRLEQAERSNMALTTAIPTTVPEKEPVLNMDGLPDPVEQPKEYGEAIARRTSDFTRALGDYHTKQQTQAKQGQGDTGALWEDFAEQYEPYTLDQDRIEYATDKVVKQAKRKGIDISRYMYGNSDRFFQDVVKVYDKTFGKPEVEVDLEPEPQQRRAAPVKEDEEADRTGGIFGGMDQGGNRAPVKPVAGDMVKDLQDLQRKSGYY